MNPFTDQPDPIDHSSGEAAPSFEQGGQIFLLPALAEPFLWELALALARRRNSLALWDHAPERQTRLSGEARLELQLAIERAGGISLVEGWPIPGEGADKNERSPLFWAVDLFGRIDAALAWGEAGAPVLARSLAALERRAQPRLMVILRPGGAPDRMEPVASYEAAGWGPLPRRTRIIRYDLGDLDAADSAARLGAENVAEFLGKR